MNVLERSLKALWPSNWSWKIRKTNCYECGVVVDKNSLGIQGCLAYFCAENCCDECVEEILDKHFKSQEI